MALNEKCLCPPWEKFSPQSLLLKLMVIDNLLQHRERETLRIRFKKVPCGQQYLDTCDKYAVNFW